jgi:glycosyltransferase involved in cell wall biosynthesis
MAEPLVSVFIRVRDEATALGEVLRHLNQQKIDGELEVVVLDNGSVDGSEQVALHAGARVFTLPREHFGYGRALNIGVRLCRGTIFVPLSAHSIPQSQEWLSELIAPLRDGSAGAAFCRQTPTEPVSRFELRRFACFPGQDTDLTTTAFLQGSAAGADPYELAIFSNSACAIRRGAALQHPFRDLPYAEDRAFVVDYVVAGGTVAYRHSPAVSYERAMTWRSAFRVAYRAQVSKHLIRELAASYTGCRFDSSPDTRSRITRAVLVGPAALVRVVAGLAEPRGRRRRAIIFALRSTGATIGLAKGALRWRIHSETLNCDSQRLDAALEHCRPVETSYASLMQPT